MNSIDKELFNLGYNRKISLTGNNSKTEYISDNAKITILNNGNIKKESLLSHREIDLSPYEIMICNQFK